jgi:hypothetical protein
MAAKKPELKEISVQSSVGGKMQIVKYQFHADYHFSMSQKYDVEGMTELEAAEFRDEAIKQLRGHLEEVGQNEIDELTELRKKLNNEEEDEA